MKLSKSKWYVIAVIEGNECKILEEINKKLNEEGLDSRVEEMYLPTIIKSTRKRGQLTEVEEVLYDSYIFLKCHLNSKLLDLINTVVGVYKFLGIEDKEDSDFVMPLDIQDNEMRLVMRRVSELNHKEEQGGEFSVGNRVLITSGAFEHFTGEVIQIINKNKVVVMVNALFNNKAKVETSTFDLKVVD